MKYVVSLNDKNYEVDVHESNAVLVDVNNIPVQSVSQVQPTVSTTNSVSTPISSQVSTSVISSGTTVQAPMPGNILSVKINVGDKVKSGDLLLVLEAMKMENEILAPCNGVVKQVLVSKGSVVNTDDVLVIL